MVVLGAGKSTTLFQPTTRGRVKRLPGTSLFFGSYRKLSSKHTWPTTPQPK